MVQVAGLAREAAVEVLLAELRGERVARKERLARFFKFLLLLRGVLRRRGGEDEEEDAARRAIVL